MIVRIRWRLLVFAIAGSTAAAWLAPAVARADGTARDKVFVGYLFRQPRTINYHLYTHLCHAFLVADADGKVRTGRGVPSDSVTAAAHKAKVKVMLSLGGWGWDKQFAAIVKNPEAFERYVKAVMEIIDTSDYDGIDLDWEYPDTADEVIGFERLVRRFRKDLDELAPRKRGRWSRRWPCRPIPAPSAG